MSNIKKALGGFAAALGCAASMKHLDGREGNALDCINLRYDQ